MKIKTKETLRNIKKAANTIKTDTKKLDQNIKNLSENISQNENGYAVEKIEKSEQILSNATVYATEKIGNWGVKETVKNISDGHKYKSLKNNIQNQRSHVNIAKTKIKEKTANKAKKATKKADEITKKTGKKIVQTIKAVVKSIGSAIKTIIAAIAAGGWIAVVVILLICIVSMIAGSIFGIFIEEKPIENTLSLSQTVLKCEDELYQEIEKKKGQYDFDECYVVGNVCDPFFAVSIYAVTVNEYDDVLIFNEEKAAVLRDIYRDIHEIHYIIKDVVENETVFKIQDNGEIEELIVEVKKRCLYINITYMTKEEAIEHFNFSNKQIELFNEIENIKHDKWIK